MSVQPPEVNANADESATEESNDIEGLDLVRLSDVEPEQVRWLWPGRIPLGKLTLLDGDPGLGKSTLTLDLAARVTRQDEMPGGEEPDLDGPAGVILLSGEDGLGDTIRPRLDAAGADVDQVAALLGVDDPAGNERLPTVGDVEGLRSAIRAYDARLLIVDPLTAYMGQHTDTHRDSDVRGDLAGLAQLADEMGVAVLAIRHLNKSQDKKALYRGGGSIAFTASARSVLLVASNPSDPSGEGRVLAQLKGNLARQQGALAFHLQEDHTGGVSIAWEGPSPHDPAGLLRESATADVSALDQAKHWLRSELSTGPVAAKDLKQRAETFGIAESTLNRAKKELGVNSEKEGFEHSQWWWRLPDAEQQGDRSTAAEDSRGGPQGHDLATFDEENAENPYDAAPSAKNAKQPEDGTLRDTPKAAKTGEPGKLREDTERSGVLSDSTVEDCQDSERDPGCQEDADGEAGESDETRPDHATSTTSTIPAAMVDGDYW